MWLKVVKTAFSSQLDSNVVNHVKQCFFGVQSSFHSKFFYESQTGILVLVRRVIRELCEGNKNNLDLG